MSFLSLSLRLGGRDTPTSGRATSTAPKSSPAQRVEQITPGQQLDRINQPLISVVEEVVPIFPSAIAALIAQYASYPICTNWFAALEHISPLPAVLPALPKRMIALLQNPATNDTHVLVYVGEENLNALVDRIAAYCAANGKAWTPPQLASTYEDFSEVGARPIESHWVFMTRECISPKCPSNRLAKMMRQFNKERVVNGEKGANYHVPLVTDALAAAILHQLASGETLFQGKHTFVRSDQNSDTMLLLGHRSKPACFRLQVDPNVENDAVATETFSETPEKARNAGLRLWGRKPTGS